MKFLSRVSLLAFAVAVIVGAFAAFSHATPPPTLPPANDLYPVDFTADPSGPLSITLDADIEAVISAEHRGDGVGTKRVVPGIRVEVFPDRAGTLPKLAEFTLDAQLVTITLPTFDGIVDFAGTSGVVHTSSVVHRSATVALDIGALDKAGLELRGRVWVKVRGVASMTKNGGAWTCAVDPFALTSASVDVSP